MMKGRRRRLLALFLTGTILFQSLTVNATETESDALPVTEDIETLETTDETLSSEETIESSDDSISEIQSESNETEYETQSESSEDAPEIDIENNELVVIDDAIQSLSLNDYKAPAAIIGEDITRREANIKYFLNEDFSYTAAIYPKAVHYQDNGQWKDIDNGLETVTLDGDSSYVQNKANRMKVGFAQNTAEEKLVDITIDGYKLSWGMDTGNRSSVRKLVANTPDLYTKAMANDAPDALQQVEITETDGASETDETPETDKSVTEETSAKPLMTPIVEDAEEELPESVAENVSEELPALNADISTETEEVIEEKEASLITENPDAARLFSENDIEGLKALEEAAKRTDFPMLVAADAQMPEKKIGILAEEQEAYTTTNIQGEESLDSDYHESVMEANAEKTNLPALESRIAYNKIAPGVNLEYILSGEELKENIILSNAASNKTFVYNCKTEGLTPELRNNAIYFKNSSGEEILYIHAPFMYDANGVYSDKVIMNLENTENGYKISIKADDNWLLEENRMYPVVIDPVISTPITYKDIKDAKVCSNYPTSNFRDTATLSTGYGNNTGDNRSFIRFTLPSINTADIIVDAQMALVPYESDSQKKQINMHEVLSDWDSGTITWNNRPSYTAAVEDYTVFKDKQGEMIQFNITNLVRDWYNGSPNYGVMIKDSIEESLYTEYFSSDCAAAYAEARPRIFITYINASGLEDYWSYHSQSVGRAGTVSVNDYTGNLVLTHATASSSGLNMPAVINHVYNSNDKDMNLGYGYGFRLNYHQTIEPVTLLDTQYYKYTDADGTKHYFYHDKDKNKWIVDSGLNLTLTIGSSNSEKYTIEDKTNQKLIFNSSGYLVKVQDSNKNTLTVSYTGNKISEIVDGAKRSIAFSYDGSGNLSQVRSPNGTKKFSYTNNCLTGITDIDGKKITYTYNNQRLLTKVTNIDNYNVNYGYSSSSPYRVVSVQEKAGASAGQSYTIDYYSDTTSFTDYKNRTENYSFNDAGNTVIISDDNGYAQTTKYLTEGSATKNKISKTSKLQYTVVQMLKNPSIASLDSWTGGRKSGSSATYTLNTVAENARDGSKSLKISVTSGSGYFTQEFTAKRGADYTFSTYVKPDEALIKNKGCTARIRYKNSSGSYVYVDSNDLIPCENGWYRLECTATIPSDIPSATANVSVIVDKAGTAYFDCLQLETGNTASRYNLIENGDHTQGIHGFSITGSKGFDGVLNTDNPNSGKPTGLFEAGIVTTSSLNVRSGPGTGYGIVGSVKLNQRVYIYGAGTDSSNTIWYKIAWVAGQRVYSGYASSAYISKESKPVAAELAIVNTSALNMRNGAGTGYSVIKSLKKDEKVYILQSIKSATGQTWYMLYYSGTSGEYIGCVLSDYILTYGKVISTISEVPAVHGCGLDNNVFMLYGDPSTIKRATQTVNVSGKTGDAYVVNAWGTGKGVTLKDNRSFGVEVTFVNTDGTKDAFVSNFLDRGIDWAFLNDVFVAKKAYSSIQVSYIYGYNENAVYFDGLSLFKEEYGSSYTYDSEGNVIGTQDAAKKANSFEYDNHNNLEKLIDAKGSNFTYTYDDKHNMTGATSSTGVKYTFAYNGFGLPTESKIIDKDKTSNYIRTSAKYSDDGNYMTILTDPLGKSIQYTYDTYTGRLTKETDANGNSSELSYNNYGQLSEVVLDSLTLANGQKLTPYVTYSYSNDRLSTVSWHGTDYIFTYDGFGNQTSVRANEQPLVRYQYENKNGQLSEEIYDTGWRFVYRYDNLERLSEIGYRLSEGGAYTALFTYHYGKDGNLAYIKDIAEGKTYRYYYDLSDRLVKTVVSDGSFYTYYYDANDNLVKVDEGDNSERYVTEYVYDSDNRETATKINGKTYTTVYDNLGRITSQTWNTSSPFKTSMAYQAGADGSQSVQLKSITSGGSTISYTYDANGNILTLTDSKGTTKYYYDEMNQLYREDNHITNKTVIYTYDGAGNIVSKKIYPKTNAATVTGTPSETIAYGYSDTWWDQMTSYGGKSVTYDAVGNPLSYLDKTMTWTKGKMLETVSDSQMDYTYTYNIDDLRTEKKNNKTGEVTAYQMTDGVIAAQTTKDSAGKVKNKMVFTYDSNDSIIAMRYNGTQYFYQKNGQDDIIGIVDDKGKVVVQYSYDSWGKLLDITGDTALGNANPFRYRSYYYDNETGFYYLGGRYYDAEVGRFINADTTELLTATPAGLTDKNLYAYCDNNPVVRKDEGGQLWGVALVGALVNLTTSFISAKVTGQEFTATDALVAVGTGALGVLSKTKQIIGMAVRGGYATYTSYKNGASVGEALVNGAMSALSAKVTVNTLASQAGVTLSTSVSAATDLTFGLGYSCVTGAVTKSMSNNRQQKKVTSKKQPARATSRIEKQRQQIAARRRLV